MDADGAVSLPLPVRAPALRQGVRGTKHRDRVVRLFRELRPALYRYLLGLGLRAEAADDAIQEAFLRFYKEIHAGAEIGNERAWLYRVAHNVALSTERTERRLVFGAESESGVEGNVAVDWADSRLNPEEQALKAEQLRRLNAAVARLTPQQRQALYLRTEGLRYREIAEVLGIGISSVAELVQRALVRITGEIHG